MKKYITVIFILITNILFACDFCGCFMGITPYDNQSSITLMYRYKSFNGYGYSGQNNNFFPKSLKTQPSYTNNNPLANNSYQSNTLRHGGTASTQTVPQRTQKDYEIYTTAELRAKYFIHQRIELNAIVPFVVNSSRTDGEMQHIEGISDITMFAAYHVLSKIMTEKFQHRLILGAGLKLPVGNYYAKNDEGERIDFLLQSGTGSIDYMAYANYIWGFKKMGINFNSTYKINGDNYYHERIANSSTNYINLFYKFRQDKNLKLIPSLQGYYEYTKGVYINDMYQQGTNVSIATAGVGLDIFYKNVALNTSFQLPVYEQKAANNLSTAGKFMIGLTYNFNQKKYLIKSKQTS